MIHITQCADVQVKSRNINLYHETYKVLCEIENIVIRKQSDIHIISGDLFEYAMPNEDERKLIYNHLIRLLRIPTLKELIIISGNHDLVKENKKQEGNSTNAIGVLASLVKNLYENSDESNKLKFFTRALPTYSSVSDYIMFYPYALEDKENWANLKTNIENDVKFKLCLYHAMIREYAEEAKLPINTSKLDNLEIFPNNSYILAGDIHEKHIYKDSENRKIFVYPGSTMQHTFNEGTFITVGEKFVVTKEAEKKSISYFGIDETTGNIYPEIIELKNQVEYFTIKLDHTIPFGVIELNLKNNKIDTNSDSKLFVKVKSSNVFITKEKQLIDLLQNVFNRKNIVFQFEYDKIIQKDTFVDNIVVNELIMEKQKQVNNDFIISQDNIDELLLSEDQLAKIFGDLVNKALLKVDGFDKDITSDAVYSDISDLFRKEMRLITDMSHSRYNIVFKTVACNSFMTLGPTKVALNDKGIVRILGTNGIGKTTLYRLIRWIITGQIIEDMKSNQAVQNNLLVFNKNLPNENMVCGVLTLTINNQPIKLTRTVTHDWKANTTEEQMYSQNWKDFVTNVKRNFEMQIRTSSGEYKTYIGDSAEKAILKWFGQTVQNLLFLDQQKIKNILNTAPKDLNNLILDYIGVDYLQKLEEHLDTVKDNLMTVAKPKQNKDEIREKMIDADIEIEKHEKNIEQINNDIQSANETTSEFEKQIQRINDELQLIGNINEQINNTIQEITEIKSYIFDLDKQITEYKEKPEFTEQAPSKDNDEIQKLQEKKNQLQLEIDKLKETRHTLSEQEKKITEMIRDLYNHEKEKTQSMIDKYNQSNINEKNILSNNFNKLIQICNETIASFANQKVELQEQLNQIKIEIQTKINEKESSKSELQSGYCPTCKRKYENFTEEHKKTLVDKIKQINEDLVILEARKKEISDDIALIDNKQTDINSIRLKLNQHEIDWNTVFVSELKNQNPDIFANIVKSNANITYNNEQLIILNEQMKIRIPQILEMIALVDLPLYDNDELAKQLRKVVNDMLENQKEINQKDKEKDSIQEQIDNKQSEYNKKFQEYQEAFKKYQEECRKIDEENKLTEENRRKKIQEEQKLTSANKKLLELKEKEPEYLNKKNELKSEQEKFEEHKNFVKELNNNLTREKLLHQGSINKKESLEKTYNEYIQYVKNNLIWKVYQSLIKKNFKEAVFEYYRSFLNNTLNYLLSDVNFKLYWNHDSELTMISCKNSKITYQPVQTSSGMETTFLGLSLIYTMHLLNVKNSVSNLFIDEVSGTLNKGNDLSYEAADYQELFVKILSKFQDKTVFIIDHNVQELNEVATYEVIPKENYSVYVKR